MMDNHKDCVNFDNDSKYKSDSFISQPISIPPRINSYGQSSLPYNYNLVHSMPINFPSYYGMGNFASNGYNSSFGNTLSNNKINLIMESFSSINNVVQTFNAFNTLINTAYNTLYTSVSTIAGVTEQMSRTQTQLYQIVNSLNIFKLIKRIILFFKRILSGDLPRIGDLKSIVSDFQSNFKSAFSNSRKKTLSYLFFITIICGPIVIYQFLKSLTQSKQVSWDSQKGKSYAAKVRTEFISRNPDELTVHQGEIVTIAPSEFQREVNWYLVSNLSGQQGLVPASFVSVLGVLNKNKNQEEPPRQN